MNCNVAFVRFKLLMAFPDAPMLLESDKSEPPLMMMLLRLFVPLVPLLEMPFVQITVPPLVMIKVPVQMDPAPVARVIVLALNVPPPTDIVPVAAPPPD